MQLRTVALFKTKWLWGTDLKKVVRQFEIFSFTSLLRCIFLLLLNFWVGGRSGSFVCRCQLCQCMVRRGCCSLHLFICFFPLCSYRSSKFSVMECIIYCMCDRIINGGRVTFHRWLPQANCKWIFESCGALVCSWSQVWHVFWLMKHANISCFKVGQKKPQVWMENCAYSAHICFHDWKTVPLCLLCLPMRLSMSATPMTHKTKVV